MNVYICYYKKKCFLEMFEKVTKSFKYWKYEKEKNALI